MSLPKLKDVEVQELSADEVHIKMIKGRLDETDKIIGHLQAYQLRLRRLADLTQAIEIDTGLYIDRDQLIKDTSRKMTSSAQVLMGLANKVI